MNLTLETVDQSIAAQEAEKAKHIGNANACDGAIQRLKFVRAKMLEPKPEPTEEPKTE